VSEAFLRLPYAQTVLGRTFKYELIARFNYQVINAIPVIDSLEWECYDPNGMPVERTNEFTDYFYISEKAEEEQMLDEEDEEFFLPNYLNGLLLNCRGHWDDPTEWWLADASCLF